MSNKMKVLMLLLSLLELRVTLELVRTEYNLLSSDLILEEMVKSTSSRHILLVVLQLTSLLTKMITLQVAELQSIKLTKT